ncbi:MULTISPECIES: tautomerase family protein [Agrobacterium]|uniref:tautomerase family protein n=1 Tax=Agrobacterium tumefaciens TaxID=358 RepID=UPI000EF1A0AA|nr:tautomerase [Agrobacterium tumefaciens]NSY09873.1 tautomerase family protein [Agrobacterium tumefaciens]NSY93435.1 tautomerase family protein [Agrobacterium tumefaciens]
MPLMKIHVLKGRSSAEVKTLLDAVHQAMVRAFNVPDRDLYQILNEHEPSHFRALDTGLDIPRTTSFVLLEVVTRPRTQQEKTDFYEILCAALAEACGIASSDVMVSIVQNTDDDWSFGWGRAQFLTGELASQHQPS